MNKQELVKEIAEDLGVIDWTVQLILDGIDSRGWLRNPGTPIDPEDIRKGDRVRIVHRDGSIVERTAEGPRAGLGEKYFLLDRPKPELPTEPGSVVKSQSGTIWVLGRNGRWWSEGQSIDPVWFEGIDWEVVG